MFTLIVLAVIGLFWYTADRQFKHTGSARSKRQRFSFAWAAVGGLIGSFFGVAGFGVGIIGTIPGAILGFLVASNSMKADVSDPRPGE